MMVKFRVSKLRVFAKRLSRWSITDKSNKGNEPKNDVIEEDTWWHVRVTVDGATDNGEGNECKDCLAAG